MDGGLVLTAHEPDSIIGRRHDWREADSQPVLLGRPKNIPALILAYQQEPLTDARKRSVDGGQSCNRPQAGAILKGRKGRGSAR